MQYRGIARVVPIATGGPTMQHQPAAMKSRTSGPAEPRDTGSHPIARLPSRLDQIRAHEFGEPEARHLLMRAGFGGTPTQIKTIAQWGPERAVDYLLDAGEIPYDAPTADRFDANIMRPLTDQERQTYRAAQQRRDEDTLARFRLQRQQRQRQDRQQITDVQRWWLERMIETPRPLEEKMTLFWHGHFATSYRTIENSYHMYLQNQFLRANALGSFADLLSGIIRDPAMLAYLDNNDSRVGQPNENLARELMELFSLGVGNYGENDIKEGARALTGYSFNDDTFRFNHNNHDKGSKTILGRSGNLDGDGFVETILAQPACAHFVAAKIYDFFALHTSAIADADTLAVRRVVQALETKLRVSKYELKPVLRKLFLSRHFYHPTIVRNRIKSPTELVVGAVRSLNTPVRDMGVLLQAMDLMGQNLLYPPSVKGWDGGRSWINTSTIFVRQNALTFLLTGRLPIGYDGNARDDRYDPAQLLDSADMRTPRLAADALLRLTLGGPNEDAARVLTDFADEHGGEADRDVLTGMLLLITAMPEYQLC
jgi:uncharacterized protein (DUF1800 family)